MSVVTRNNQCDTDISPEEFNSYLEELPQQFVIVRLLDSEEGNLTLQIIKGTSDNRNSFNLRIKQETYRGYELKYRTNDEYEYQSYQTYSSINRENNLYLENITYESLINELDKLNNNYTEAELAFDPITNYNIYSNRHDCISKDYLYAKTMQQFNKIFINLNDPRFKVLTNLYLKTIAGSFGLQLPRAELPYLRRDIQNENQYLLNTINDNIKQL